VPAVAEPLVDRVHIAEGTRMGASDGEVRFQPSERSLPTPWFSLVVSLEGRMRGGRAAIRAFHDRRWDPDASRRHPPWHGDGMRRDVKIVVFPTPPERGRLHLLPRDNLRPEP
jgi:hypothetical protein